MHATTAIHQLGDISRPNEEDLPAGYNLACIYLDADGQPILGHDPRHGPVYVGNWISGLGFINVHFPVSGTRPLSPIEIEWLADKSVSV
jgi:hypothetical protein